MAAPSIASGAAVGGAVGSAVPLIGTAIGSAIGGIIGALSGLFGNNDNAVISARDKIVKKFRASTAGAANADLFPIKQSDGGILFNKFSLEHSQIDDRKIGGNYDKEWIRVAEFGGTMLMLMYPDHVELIDDYIAFINNKKKPDHAFAAIVNFVGPSFQTTEQLLAAIGMDAATNIATDPAPSGGQLVNNAGPSSGGGNIPTWVWFAGGGVLFILFFGKKLFGI